MRTSSARWPRVMIGPQMESAEPFEKPGTIIAGRYRVEALVGCGGMAAVYRALDERTGEQLAIKRSRARDPAKLQRHASLLEREFHTLAQLAHPRIIMVYDYGVDERGPYYTMELLEGADLEQSGRVSWPEVSAVLSDVASSLAILHARGLVHRDVSTRNVHHTSGGRVKLIDFGAMTSMGVATDVVGTPPFMAPEVVQLQALDGRADLFSLGALGYRLLTGRHAYPARRIGDLRDAWRSKPVPPRTIVPDVPVELSALLMRLLALDRGGRPQNAAEIIARLRALAGLSADDTPEVTRAYLTTPMLVGREAALLEVRKRMLSLVRGDGGVLLVRGESGSGRSRLLDACALEGKLLGSTIARADARDAGQGDFGVARALGEQLLAEFPRAALEASRLSSHVLGQLFESLRDQQAPATDVPADRAVLIRELRDFILALAKRERLLLVVDDVDRIDEPSRALLAALAHRTERHPILLAVSTERSASGSLAGPLRLLDDIGDAIELEGLQAADTHALIGSLFGDVPGLVHCATRIHALSHGNPRAVMEFAQHLVDTGRARYEAGVWSLPAALDDRMLPNTLAASLGARLAELSAGARELAAALALADDYAPALPFYPALTAHGDGRRVFRALDELVAARVLIAGTDRYAFAHRGFATVSSAAIEPVLRPELHLRIAAVLASSGGAVLRRAHHLLEAERDAEAIELLTSTDLQGLYPPIDLLRRAIAAAQHLQLPAAALHRLRMALLIHAPLSVDDSALREVYAEVLRRLDRDTGLARYRELEDVPADARLVQALTQTQQAYDSTPEHERGCTVIEAVRELARLYGAVTAMAVNTFDLALLESLPRLEPLFPLSPSLPVLAQIRESGEEWIRGRVLHAREIHAKVRARLAEPDRAGLDESQHERAVLLIEYGIGLVDAVYGLPSAEEHARVLEAHRATRVNAWRVRALSQLAIGDVVEARRLARRAELLEAQEGLRERYPGSTLGAELGLYVRLGDLLGVKSLLERLSVVGARHRGWQPVERFARASHCDLQGDAEGALRHLEAGLAAVPPLHHPFFPTLAAAHVRVLFTLGRGDEAARRARGYVRLCAEHELPAPDLAMAAALVLGRSGHHSEALEVLDPVIAQAEQLGRVGFGLGALYESRARLAISMSDGDAFDRAVERCAEQYACARNAALGERLARLYEEAHAAGLRQLEAAGELLGSLSPSEPASELESIHSRMAECIDAADRARCALTLLLQSTVSTTGYLYRVRHDRRVALIAALPDPPSDSALQDWAEQCAAAFDPTDGDGVTATATMATVSQVSEPVIARNTCYHDAEGRRLELVLLADEREGARSLSGVLVLHVGHSRRLLPPRALCASIARELLADGDAN